MSAFPAAFGSRRPGGTAEWRRRTRPESEKPKLEISEIHFPALGGAVVEWGAATAPKIVGGSLFSELAAEWKATDDRTEEARRIEKYVPPTAYVPQYPRPRLQHATRHEEECYHEESEYGYGSDEDRPPAAEVIAAAAAWRRPEEAADAAWEVKERRVRKARVEGAPRHLPVVVENDADNNIPMVETWEAHEDRHGRGSVW